MLRSMQSTLVIEPFLAPLTLLQLSNADSSAPCYDDNTFGPGTACRPVDFTIKFEKTILSILPNVLMLLLGNWRVAYLLRKSVKTKVKLDTHGTTKLLLALAYLATSATLISVTKKVFLLDSATTTSSSVVHLVAACVLLFVIAFEHYRTIAPSTLISCYTLALGLFGSAELRTYTAINISTELMVVKSINVASLFGLLIVESISKRRLLRKQYSVYPPYSTTSSFLRAFFPHTIRLLYTGYKRRLTIDDLSELPPHVLAKPATAKLAASMAQIDKKSPVYLLRASINAFGLRILTPIPPRILLVLCTFGQVFLVQDITKIIADPSVPQERAWALVGGFVLIYTGLALATFFYWEKTFNLSVEYRAALIGVLYSKSLRLTSTAAREVGQGAATTYFSVDAERVVSVLVMIHEIWAALLSMTLGLVLLWYQASYAMFAPFVLVFVTICLAGAGAKYIGDLQTAWLGAVDNRIKLLTSIFSQLLPIKLGAYEQILHAKVTELRAKETKALQKFYFAFIMTFSLATVAQTFAGLVTIGFYPMVERAGKGNGPLNVTRIFTIITIVNLLNEPVAMVGRVLPAVLGGWASLKRLQEFILLPETTIAAAVEVEKSSSGELESKDPIDTLLQPVPHSVPSNVKITGDFGWDTEKTVLHDMNVELAAGELVMVVGPVASGKSSLLMAILGEMVSLGGIRDVDARTIAIVTQSPFIYPGTIRDNILLNKPYDRARLQRVIAACALDRDIGRLTKGELSVLGEKGITLSGGQRQRVSLARALYADADLVLLDDTFSALDGETESHVFRSLFDDEGILRGKTTVLVTHAIQHLEKADKVLVLDDGRTTHFGTFQELRESGETYALAARSGVDPMSQFIKADTDEMIDEEDEEDEEMLWSNDSTRKGDALRFFFGAVGHLRTFGLLGLVMLLSAATGGLQGFLKHFSTNVNNDNFAKWMGGYVGIATAVIILTFAAFFYFAVVLTQRGSRAIHSAELTGLLSSPPSFFHRNSAGKILNRFSQDIQAADFTFPLCFLGLVLSLFSLISTLVFILIATPWLGISFLVVFPLFGLILRFYVATSKLQRLHLGSTSPLYTLFSTTVGGLTSVRAFHAEQFFSSKSEELLNRSQSPYWFRLAGQLFLRVVLTWLTAVLAIGLSIAAVALRRSTSASFLGVAMSQITGLAASLMGTMITYAEVENSLVSLERIHEFAELPAEAAKSISGDDSQSDCSSRSWQTDGSVEFRNVSLRYKDDLPLALDDVSFRLEGGMKLGICGRTGSGKSSTLLALFRAIDHALMQGHVLIDGVDTTQISLRKLRDSMSIVTQDPFLWRGSVRDNLDIEGFRTDDEIWTALRSVSMEDAIKELPEQLRSLSIVDEESFSKGQRQLLCLARALLRRRAVVVLDESTSSMDLKTDAKIRSVVATQMQSTTIIAVAHRISTIIGYDKIMVLEDGKVAEFGTPSDLLSDPESRFSRLAAAQGLTSASDEAL